MPARPDTNTPVSLLWLPDDLYWKQDLSAASADAGWQQAEPLPLCTFTGAVKAP